MTSELKIDHSEYYGVVDGKVFLKKALPSQWTKEDDEAVERMKKRAQHATDVRKTVKDDPLRNML